MLAALIVAFALGGPIPVSCTGTTLGGDSIAPHAGWYDVEHHAIVLAPDICRGLRYPTLEGRAYSLHVVLHEAAHAQGYRNEHKADCAATRMFKFVALKLTIMPRSWIERGYRSVLRMTGCRDTSTDQGG